MGQGEAEMKILVVACAHREPLIVPHLVGRDYYLHLTPDYVLPEGWAPSRPYRKLVHNQTNHMRCCYGHRDVMQRIQDYALILEDDAVPNCPDWYEVCEEAAKLLDTFNIVSLHSRELLSEVWEHRPWWGGREAWVRGGGWCVGSLAYLISRRVAANWIERRYEGLPMDLGLCELAGGKFVAIVPSPFDHGVGTPHTFMHADGKVYE
jgi:hypothetical protein